MAHILVVDDERAVRSVVQQMLALEGHTVVEAADGEQALKIFHTQPIDLLITDLFMPGKEGIDTIVTVRKHFPQVKILAISGGASAVSFDALPAAKHLGADQTLLKPFARQQLVDVVHHLLAGSMGSDARACGTAVCGGTKEQ